MKLFITLLITISICQTVFCQSDTVELSLSEAISIAQKDSYESMIDKNQYLSADLNYNNYKAGTLPKVSLSIKPSTFNRYISKQFNPSDTSYKYFEEQNLNSTMSFSVDQNLPFSGGSVYINSDIGRLANFGYRENVRFSAAPIRVGFQQSLFGFNKFKWEKMTQPLRYEKEKREFIQSKEEIALKSIGLFFTCAKARLNLNIAKNNLSNADSLYNIGRKRFEISSINKADLLMLKLEVINSQNNLQQSKNNYERSQLELASFLGLEEDTKVVVVFPEKIIDISIDPQKVMDLVKENNPAYLSFKLEEIELERTVALAKSEARINANLNASIGLNQTGGTLKESYTDPLNQQRFDISINIPLVDWGVKKGRYNLAVKERETNLISIKQKEINLKHEIGMMISQFNLQKSIIITAKEASEIASDIYQIKLQRFILGETNVNDLIIQNSKRDKALSDYYSEIKSYWELFYNIRKITLYDFVLNKPLTE